MMIIRTFDLILNNLLTEMTCGPPPTIEKTSHTNDGTALGSKAYYSCLPGYMYQQGVNTKTCNGSGVWDGEDLLCTGAFSTLQCEFYSYCRVA